MHWITRCPACITHFKVVPDQLKMAQGWLRCGLCHQAFDSTGMVLAWPDMQAAASELADKDGPLDIQTLLLQEDRPHPLLASTPLTTALQAPNGLTEAASTSESAVASFDTALTTFQAAAREQVAGLRAVGTPNQTAWPEVIMGTEGTEGVVAAQDVAATKRRSARSHGAVAVLLFLSVLWLAQGLWVARQPLARLAPGLTESFQAACLPLGCLAVLPPLVRDAVLIDSSDWVPHAGGFLLRWSLRNASAQSVAMPALELTLMDAQDQVLVRRVLDVAQLGAPAELLPGEVWQAQRLILTEVGVVPSGYRLLNFYP